MRITRSLAIPALALGLLAAGSAGSALTQGGWTSNPPATEQAAAVTCQEDEPCWDCEVMGNRVCGLTDIPANDAQRATAWEAWDRAEGWRQLRVDPSEEVRVDVVGYSPVQPTEKLSLDGGEVSLRGADGNWYVFDAR